MSRKTKRILFTLMALLPLCLTLLACFRSGTFTLPPDSALGSDPLGQTLTYVYNAVTSRTVTAVPYYVQWLYTYCLASLMVCFADLTLSVLLWIPRRISDLLEGGADA